MRHRRRTTPPGIAGSVPHLPAKTYAAAVSGDLASSGTVLEVAEDMDDATQLAAQAQATKSAAEAFLESQKKKQLV